MIRNISEEKVYFGLLLVRELVCNDENSRSLYGWIMKLRDIKQRKQAGNRMEL